MTQAKSTEKVVQEIRRKTRRRFSADVGNSDLAGHRHLVGDQRNLRCLPNVRPGPGVDEGLPEDELSTLP